MISKATIDKYELDSESLEKLFTADRPARKVKDLTELLGCRIREWRERNFSDYRLWAAVDFAFDTPLEQTTPTMLRHIMDTCKDKDSMLSALRGWGLDETKLFSCEESKVGDIGIKKWSMNLPAFFKTIVPLVRAYLVIRQSKIFNDRNKVPLFDYEPLWPTAENRLLCEVVSGVVETMATNFGYPATLRDFIFNALMYSVALKFPVEPWTQYKQEGEDGKEIVEKEGVRHVVPHISRIGYDLSFPLHTLNTGTGCTYGMYWEVIRWGTVDTNVFWNTDKIPHGFNWLNPESNYYNYFQEVYPCGLEFPVPRRGRTTDRENMAIQYYNRNDYDSAFFISYVFMELVPADWGLGKYKNKVWMKFTIGSDQTIMYAEVFPYRPIDYIGYDADSGRGRNSSLALEIIPFQDLASNALNQYLLTIKRNLTNITFYNNQVIDANQIKALNQNSNGQFGQLNFIGFNPLEMERGGNNMDEIFKSATFPFADPSQTLLSLNTIISLLERVLVVSAQESGSAASHQQSKKEVELTSANTSNRVAYTSSFVDEGQDAWGRQIWESCQCYMDGNDVVANVSSDIPNLVENVKKLGFEFVDGEPKAGEKKVVIKGKLKNSMIKLVQLVSRRASADRNGDQATAQAMFTAISSVSSSQFLSQVVDPASVVELLEIATKLAGGDHDFKFKLNTEGAVGQQVQQIVAKLEQEIAAVKQDISKSIETDVVQPVTKALGEEAQKVEQNSKDIETLAELVAKIKDIVSPAAQLPPAALLPQLPPEMAAPPMQPPPVQTMPPNANPNEIPIPG